MDAKRNMAKEPQPREGGTRQMEGMDLESVIERAQGHDAEALGEIYRRYVRRVFGLCRYMLDSRESAEDATSEVFLKLQRSIERYADSGAALSAKICGYVYSKGPSQRRHAPLHQEKIQCHQNQQRSIHAQHHGCRKY